VQTEIRGWFQYKVVGGKIARRQGFLDRDLLGVYQASTPEHKTG
jgi:hypothetical protein